MGSCLALATRARSDMSTQPVNPYSPPLQIGDHEMQAGITKCPWCRDHVPFKTVYWSSGPRITCPSCRKVSLRRKYGVPPGLTETLLGVFWVILIPSLIAVLTESVSWSVVALAIGLPFFLMTDFLVDRRLAYLAVADQHRYVDQRQEPDDETSNPSRDI